MCMYNFNYIPTTLGVQSWREIISGGTRTKKVEYHWIRGTGRVHESYIRQQGTSDSGRLLARVISDIPMNFNKPVSLNVGDFSNCNIGLQVYDSRNLNRHVIADLTANEVQTKVYSQPINHLFKTSGRTSIFKAMPHVTKTKNTVD
jgi:hypothetical protein